MTLSTAITITITHAHVIGFVFGLVFWFLVIGLCAVFSQ